MEEALQWLYKKKLMHLESEANLIREQLLQESLAMRRSLELSSIESNEFASSSRQKCVALNILEDLLRIQITAAFSNNLIFINLQQNIINYQLNNQLEVTFVHKDINKQLPKNTQQELKYLQKSFEGLTLGTCHNILTKDNNIWSFNW